MAKMQTAPAAGFTPGERDYIRRELDMFFSTLPTVAEGFQPVQTGYVGNTLDRARW
jgi:hypothetical protein